MNQLAQKIANYCIICGFISADDFEWCTYGIEKRITSFITGFILALIGTVLFGIERTFSFVFPFHFLRKRTSGYHATTYISCFFFINIFGIFLHINFFNYTSLFLLFNFNFFQRYDMVVFSLQQHIYSFDKRRVFYFTTHV